MQGYYHVVPESETVLNYHHVLFVFRVIVSQRLQDLYLDFALLMQFLFVLDNLNRYYFFLFVVQTFQNHSESTLAELLLDLIAVIYVVADFIKIVSVLVILPVIVYLVRFLRLIHRQRLLFLSRPALQVHEVHSLVLSDLLLLN